MNRKALLFGNTNGLPGVQKDLINFRNFLMSDIGGAWCYRADRIDNTEIILKENVSKKWLEETLVQLKEEALDYLIIYFSGHGGREKRETFISLNKYNVAIAEDELKNIAERQLTIFDCCRSCKEDEIQLEKSIDSYALMQEFSAKHTIRKAYENRIMQAGLQQVVLYSCDLTECSIDDDGGIYTKNFLEEAKNIVSGEKTVLGAHNVAAELTSEESDYEQNPVCDINESLPRKEQLIISLKLEHVYG